jgi:uncharacterized Zn finger protein
VFGTDEYEVQLTVTERGLAGECSCPYGQDGFFCKHCVATGLKALKLGPVLPGPGI